MSSSNSEKEKRKLFPTIAEVRRQDIWNDCAVDTLLNGALGGGIGLFTGLFIGSCWGSCKASAVIGLIYSGTECVIKMARPNRNYESKAVAGCVTGAAISGKSGPTASCVGCAGFAAISVLLEKLTKDLQK